MMQAPSGSWLTQNAGIILTAVVALVGTLGTQWIGYRVQRERFDHERAQERERRRLDAIEARWNERKAAYDAFSAAVEAAREHSSASHVYAPYSGAPAPEAVRDSLERDVERHGRQLRLVAPRPLWEPARKVALLVVNKGADSPECEAAYATLLELMHADLNPDGAG